MWSTPDGMLAEEVGQGPAYKAEIVADKNVRKVLTVPSACFLTAPSSAIGLSRRVSKYTTSGLRGKQPMSSTCAGC